MRPVQRRLGCPVSNNLAHCFACRRNINNIDLLIALGYPFRAAVVRFQQYLRLFHQQQAMPAPAVRPPERTAQSRLP